MTLRAEPQTRHGLLRAVCTTEGTNQPIPSMHFPSMRLPTQSQACIYPPDSMHAFLRSSALPSLPPSTLCFPTPTAAAHSHPNLPDRAVLAKDICIACKHEICHACKHQAGMALCVFHACMQESMHENPCIHACKNPCTCNRACLHEA